MWDKSPLPQHDTISTSFFIVVDLTNARGRTLGAANDESLSFTD